MTSDIAGVEVPRRLGFHDDPVAFVPGCDGIRARGPRARQGTWRRQTRHAARRASPGMGPGRFRRFTDVTLAEVKAILAEWAPNISVVDMDHDDATAVLKLLGASNTLKRSGTPVLGLTRRGDLKTKLRAFDLGVDDILPNVDCRLCADRPTGTQTQHLALLDSPANTACPYCSVELDPLPKAKKRCPGCGQPIYVRSGSDGLTYLLQVGDLPVLEAAWAAPE